jgi:hypothetical protein
VVVGLVVAAIGQLGALVAILVVMLFLEARERESATR